MDSVIIVSVIVSIATSPITGAASLILMESISFMFIPDSSAAIFNEWYTPLTFSLVPLIPVVATMPLDMNSTPASVIFPIATSVLAFPISIPAIIFILSLLYFFSLPLFSYTSAASLINPEFILHPYLFSSSSAIAISSALVDL